MQELTAFLPDRRKLNQVTLGHEIGLLAEFTPRGCDNIVAGFDQALRDGPHASIFLRPKWPPGMGEQDFEIASAAEYQNPGADLSSLGH